MSPLAIRQIQALSAIQESDGLASECNLWQTGRLPLTSRSSGNSQLSTQKSPNHAKIDPSQQATQMLTLQQGIPLSDSNPIRIPDPDRL
jgi:hypothetical protein